MLVKCLLGYTVKQKKAFGKIAQATIKGVFSKSYCCYGNPQLYFVMKMIPMCLLMIEQFLNTMIGALIDKEWL